MFIHQIRITLHSKNTMAIQEEVEECHHPPVERKDHQLLMDTEVAMIREEAARGKAIQMEARRLVGDNALLLWNGRPCQILEVSRMKEGDGFTLMIRSERTTRTGTTETIKDTTNISRSSRLG